MKYIIASILVLLIMDDHAWTADAEMVGRHEDAIEEQARLTPNFQKSLASPPRAPQSNNYRIRQAKALFVKVLEHHSALETEIARTKLAELAEQYPEIKESKDYKKVTAELAVIGRDAGELEAAKWFQGECAFSSAAVTLLVFWESWCPHCQDEMPKMEQFFKKYQEKGLNIVGLTKISDSSTTAVFAFIGEHNLSFPIAKDSGIMSDRYDVERVPGAVIVRDGKVLWRGSPQRITEETITRALNLQ